VEGDGPARVGERPLDGVDAGGADAGDVRAAVDSTGQDDAAEATESPDGPTPSAAYAQPSRPVTRFTFAAQALGARGRTTGSRTPSSARAPAWHGPPPGVPPGPTPAERTGSATPPDDQTLAPAHARRGSAKVDRQLGIGLVAAAALVLVLGFALIRSGDSGSTAREHLVNPAGQAAESGVTGTDTIPPSQPAVPVLIEPDGEVLRPDAEIARITDPETGEDVVVPLPPSSTVDDGRIVPGPSTTAPSPTTNGPTTSKPSTTTQPTTTLLPLPTTAPPTTAAPTTTAPQTSTTE
jgi:hypothetical protein